MDTRLKKLSYSSNLTLHACPRKYQLYKLNSETTAQEDIPTSVTFAFGTSVGIGIQSLVSGDTEEQAIWQAFCGWDTDLLSENIKGKKDIWKAIFAIQHFNDIRSQGYLSDFSIVRINGKPAVELSFCIDLGDGFTYRGYVDAVLQHNETGEVVVLELKTTGGQVNSASYKNSSQAIGYSVVLDKLFPDLSAYSVIYLVYSTKTASYEQLIFPKSLLQRALWLQELLLTKQTIEMYEESVYPMHGESCFNFYRECEYLGLCTLSTERLIEGEHIPREEPEYTYYLTIQELIQSQLDKGSEE